MRAPWSLQCWGRHWYQACGAWGRISIYDWSVFVVQCCLCWPQVYWISGAFWLCVLQLSSVHALVVVCGKTACPARGERIRVASSLRVGWEELGWWEGEVVHSEVDDGGDELILFIRAR